MEKRVDWLLGGEEKKSVWGADPVHLIPSSNIAIANIYLVTVP